MNSLSNIFSCENISVNFFSVIGMLWWIIIGFILGYKYMEIQCKKVRR